MRKFCGSGAPAAGAFTGRPGPGGKRAQTENAQEMRVFFMVFYLLMALTRVLYRIGSRFVQGLPDDIP
jgi:hypothetical protein